MSSTNFANFSTAPQDKLINFLHMHGRYIITPHTVGSETVTLIDEPDVKDMASLERSNSTHSNSATSIGSSNSPTHSSVMSEPMSVLPSGDGTSTSHHRLYSVSPEKLVMDLLRSRPSHEISAMLAASAPTFYED